MFLQKDKHQYHLFLLKRWFLFFFQKDFLLKKNFPIKNSIFFFSLKDVKLFIHFPNVKSQDFKESKRRKLKKSEEKGINLHHASQKLILLFNFSPEEINQCVMHVSAVDWLNFSYFVRLHSLKNLFLL